MDWLSAPFHYAFMQTGGLAAILVGVTCATLGVHVVVRRLAFLGDALAHAALPGLVLASLGGWSLTAGALLAGAVTALGIGRIARRQVLGNDTAIGILFTSMLALGILLASLKRSFRDFSHVLFGNLLGVSWGDLLVIAAVAVVVLSVLLLLHKEFVLTAVDPLYAAAIGLPVPLLRDVLLLLLVLTVVVGIRATGVVLTNALLITPAASAALLTDRLPQMMLLAAGVAVLSALVGLYSSYYWHVASGAAIVLTCTACFGVALGLRAWWQRRWCRPGRVPA